MIVWYSCGCLPFLALVHFLYSWHIYKTEPNKFWRDFNFLKDQKPSLIEKRYRFEKSLIYRLVDKVILRSYHVVL